LIEGNLGHEASILCCPGGGRTPEIEHLALEVGYAAMTTAGDSSGKTPNIPGADPKWMRRIGAQDTWRVNNRDIARTDGKYLLWRLGLFQGKKVFAVPLSLRRALWSLRAKASGRRQ
jgi:hypothetical protein